MPNPKSMKMSERGRAILVARESRRLAVYDDQGGRPTIGVGHLLTPDELATGTIRIGMDSIPWSRGISVAQSNTLLDQDIAIHEGRVRQYVTANLKQCQFDALVSFSFNTPVRAFRDSTLIRMINQGDMADIPAQFRRWNKVTLDGKKAISKGLIARREEEIKIWLGEGYTK